MATTRLSDGNEKIACEGCGKPKSSCTCGCKTCGGGMPNLTINIDSNNKRGYNTLNPGNIERDTMVYPMPAQVVESGSSVYASEQNAIVPDKPKMNLPPRKPKQKRVFLPEFL